MTYFHFGAAAPIRISMMATATISITSVKPASPAARVSGRGRGSGGIAGTLQDLLHVGPRLLVRRHAAVAAHRALPGVVGGQRPREVAAVEADQVAQVADAALDVL